MNKKLYKTLTLSVSIAALFATERFCHKQTKGFALTKIQSDLAFNPDWSVADLSQPEQIALNKALDQPYRFFGSGGQSYAFLSADGMTVIKFFKHHHMRPNSAIKHLLPFFKDYFETHEKRLNQLFESCKLAYENFKEETGLIAVHLNPSNRFPNKLTIIDKIGIAHAIDLNHLTFVVQKRAELAFSKLEHQIKAGNIEAAKQSIAALIHHINIRCQKGIKDLDTGLKRNFGYLGDQAIAIDIGSFTKMPELSRSLPRINEVLIKTERLKRWLAKHYPEYLEYYQEQISALEDF